MIFYKRRVTPRATQKSRPHKNALKGSHSVNKVLLASTHAQCWTHTRRQFIEAENDEPDAVTEVLALIRQLYQLETEAVNISPQ